MSDKLDISIVVPAYNEEESLQELNDWISRVMEKHGFSYEILVVDDGSTDNTWQKTIELSQVNPNFERVEI